MTEEGIEKLIRPELVGFGGYAASKSAETLKSKLEAEVEDIIKLDANENPYGCSPRVNRALAEYKNINIYPDAGQQELREQLQKYTGVPAQHIVASAGSDQLIDLIMRLFVSPADEVINCIPTFAMFDFFIKLCSGKAINVPRDEQYNVDVAAVKKAISKKTKLIFLATPNNPTGTITPREDIIEILDTGIPTVVDEAYYEFTGETMALLVGKYENLMLLRTFSKWAGLAGLRVGYGMFPVKIADYILKIKEPYCVNAAALAAVRETLQDTDYLMANVKNIIGERERLFSGLQRIEWLKPYPSQANFILCSILKGKARQLQQSLQDRGILVRYFDQPLLENCVRISVGKPEQNDILLETLREIGEELNG